MVMRGNHRPVKTYALATATDDHGGSARLPSTLGKLCLPTWRPLTEIHQFVLAGIVQRKYYARSVGCAPPSLGEVTYLRTTMLS
jgi:hypothetical protein